MASEYIFKESCVAAVPLIAAAVSEFIGASVSPLQTSLDESEAATGRPGQWSELLMT